MANYLGAKLVPTQNNKNPQEKASAGLLSFRKEGDMALGSNTPDMPYDKSYFKLNPSQFVSPSNVDNIRESVVANQNYFLPILNQTVVGEILGGTIESIGGLGKIPQRILNLDDAFKQNAVEEFGSSLREWAQDVTPMYMSKHAQNDFAPDDASWWANMAPSTASTISMMLPAMGTAKAAAFISRGVRALGAMADVGEAAKIIRGAETAISAWDAVKIADTAAAQAGRFSKVGWFTDVFVPAYFSRQMDSAREATGRYKQYYDEYKNLYKNDKDGEAKARKAAANAAHSGYIDSHANMIFDLIEWTALDKMLKPLEKGFAEKMNSALYRNVMSEGKYSAEVGRKVFGIDGVKKLIAGTYLPNIAATTFSEGFDETMMDFWNDDAKKRNDIKLGIQEDDGLNTIERILKHHSKAKNWDSFVGGALGGLLMGGIGYGKGAIQSKFFSKNEHVYINNMANTFMEQSKTFEETIKHINNAMSKGDVTRAVNLRNSLIVDVIHKAHQSGTLDSFKTMYGNLAKLSKEDVASNTGLDFLKSDDGKEQFDFGKFNSELGQYADIYAKEMSRYRRGNDTDYLVNHHVATEKVHIAMKENIIKNNAQHNFDEKSIDKYTLDHLNNMGEHSVEATDYYNSLNNTKLMIAENNRKMMANETDNATREYTKDRINIEIKRLEDKREAATDDIEKSRIDILIEHRKADIALLDNQIEAANKFNEASKAKNEAIRNSFNEKKASLKNLVTYKAEIDNLQESNQSALGNLTNGQSYIDTLKTQIKQHEDNIKYYESAEAREFFESYSKQLRTNQENEIVKTFKDKLKGLTESDEIDAVLSDFTSKNKLTPEIIRTLHDVAKAHKGAINHATNTSARYDAETSTHTDSEYSNTIDEKDTLEKALKRNERDRKNDLKQVERQGVVAVGRTEKFFRRQQSNILSLNKAEANVKIKMSMIYDDQFDEGPEDKVYYGIDKVDIEAQINKYYDERIQRIKDHFQGQQASDSQTPTGGSNTSEEISQEPGNDPLGKSEVNTATTSKGFTFNVGDKVFIRFSDDSITTVSFEVHSIDTNSGTFRYISSHLDNNGNRILIPTNIENAVSESELIPEKQTTQTNKAFTGNLLEDIQTMNDSIELDNDHIYHYTDANGTVHNSTISASKAYGNPYVETGKSSATSRGNNIDALVRDFFQGKTSEASQYGLTAEHFDSLQKYLKNLQSYFNSKGLTVLSNNVRMFDVESGLGCELDILCVDKDNNVYIFDTKTKRIGENESSDKFFKTDSKGYNSFHGYIKQLNIYAKQFEKTFGVRVKGIGIIPIGINYNSNSTDSQIDYANPMSFTEEALELAVEQNKNRHVQNSVPREVTFENGIINIEINPEVLNEPSSDVSQTIAQRLKFDVEPAREILPQLTDTHELAQRFSNLVNKLSEISRGLSDPDTKAVFEELVKAYKTYFGIYKDGDRYRILPTELFARMSEAQNVSLVMTINNIVGKNAPLFESLMERQTIQNVDLKSYLISVSKDIDIMLQGLYSGMIINDSINGRNMVDNLEQIPELSLIHSRGVINSLEQLIKNAVTSERSFYINHNLRVQLIQNLVQLKKVQTLDTNATLTIPDIYKLIKFAYINTDSKFDIGSLSSVLVNIPNLVEHLKNDAKGNIKSIVTTQIQELKDNNVASNIHYDAKTGNILGTLESGEEVALEWTEYADRAFHDMYRSIDNSLFVTKKDNYKLNDILEIMDNYNPTITPNSSFIVEVNPELNNVVFSNTDASKIESRLLPNDTTIYDIVNNLTDKSKLNLKLQEDGTIHVVYRFKNEDHVIGIIKNPNESNGVHLIDGNNSYVGVSSLNEKDTILKLLFGDNFDSSHPANNLSVMQHFRMIMKSNNKKANVVSDAKNQFTTMINLILNAHSDDSINGKIGQVVDRFMALNNPDYEPGTYTADNIEKVMDILFFGMNNGFTDNYTATPNDIKNRIGMFDKVQRNNHIRYSNIRTAFNSTSDVLKANVSSISKPSILNQRKNTGYNTLSQSAVKTSVDGSPKKIFIINKRDGHIVDAETGAELSDVARLGFDNLTSKQDGFHVVVPSTNGKYSTFPVKQSTLFDSYENMKHSSGSSNMGSKAVSHVTEFLLKALIHDETLMPKLVGIEDYEAHALDAEGKKLVISKSNAHIRTLLEEYGIPNIIINDNNASEKQWPYFSIYKAQSPNRDGFDTVLKFTTYSDEGVTYYKVISNSEGTTVYTLEEPRLTSTNDRESYEAQKEVFLEKMASMRNINTTGVTRKSYNAKEQNYAEKVASIFEDKSDPSKSVIAHLIRQTNYDKGKNYQVQFKGNSETLESKDSFVDPITQTEYTNAMQHAIDTNSIYSDIDFVAREDEDGHVTPVSNLNPYGPAGLRFNVEVDNVTQMQKGELNVAPENTLKTIAYNNDLGYKTVFDAIEYIDSQINADNVTDHHIGLPFDQRSKDRILSTSYTKANGQLHINFGYTDKFIQELYGSNVLNNPIFGVLHERIHKTIMVVAENAEFSTNPVENAKAKLAILELHISEMKKFIDSFDEQFHKQLIVNYDKDHASNPDAASTMIYNKEEVERFANELGFDNKESMMENLEGLIRVLKDESSKVEQRILEIQQTIESGDISKIEAIKYGDAIAQELYAYMTNPYFMKALSLVQPASKYNRRHSGESFIDKLINMLLKIYNVIASKVSNEAKYKEIVNTGYLEDARSMLSDLYNDFANKEIVKPIENDNNSPVNNPEGNESDSEITYTDDDLDLLSMEYNPDDYTFDMKSFGTSNKSTIFVENSLHAINQSFADDNNLPIC